MKIKLWRLALAIALLVPAAASAQLLTDPTRPPAGYLGTGGDAAVAGGSPVLQSVMISSSVKAAIISGEVVHLGEKFGSARLVRISGSEVVLKEGDEERVLKLYPGVQKSSAATGEATFVADSPRGAAMKRDDAGRTAAGGGER